MKLGNAIAAKMNVSSIGPAGQPQPGGTPTGPTSPLDQQPPTIGQGAMEQPPVSTGPVNAFTGEPL